MIRGSKNVSCLISILSIFAFAGCATNRGYLRVEVPTADLTTQIGKQVFIRSVQDNREFQDNPATPDIPSLGFGGVQQATKEIKSKAIARKRNSYGKALGDILLEEGQTVETVIYETVRNSLYALGYTVINNKDEAKQDAIIMDISIDKYWGWFNPGFWSITIMAEIATTIQVIMPGQEETKVIQASATNKCQMANTNNWKKVFRSVLEDYIGKAKGEFQSLKM